MKARAGLRHPNADFGLIPPHELFGRILSGRLIPDFDLPFGERVERAWKRLLAGFEEDEHERLREVLVEVIEGERNEAPDRESC